MIYTFNSAWMWVLVVLSLYHLSQTAVADSNYYFPKDELPVLLQRYLTELKLRKTSKNLDNNNGSQFETHKREDEVPMKMPDGEPPERAVGPGNPLPSTNDLVVSKRADDGNYDMTCKEEEWFVFIDDMPACGKLK